MRKFSWRNIWFLQPIWSFPYRLRYNTNPDQSMKGDDVLLFDLDSDPVRIVVGESKFRGTPDEAVCNRYC
ncbi:MAG: Hachiman antiphage defense system protein HamA [Oscillospiraceae bacterium]